MRMSKEKGRKVLDSRLRGSISSLIPLSKYDESINAFVYQDGTLMDMLKIVSKDWNNKSQSDIEFELVKWAKFYRVYADDIKIITLNFKCNTKAQQKYLNHRIEQQRNVQLKTHLERKLREVEYLEENNTNREFYLLYFAESEENLEKNKLNIMNVLGPAMVSEMPVDKKIQILYKIGNKTSVIREKTRNSTPDGEKNNVLKAIQPKGGISFRDEKIIKTGDGYECCIHVYDYPPSLYRYWLSTLCNVNNVVTVIDISTDDIIQVKKNINKSMKEQAQRSVYSTNYSEKYDAHMRYAELQRLYDEIQRLGEIIKLVHIRMYVSDRTIQGLEEQCKRIMGNLESSNYQAAIFLNEGKNEWLSMYNSYTMQNYKNFAIPGQTFQCNTLAGGLPFYFSSLEDKYGSVLGFTPCGGNVLFDLFNVSEKRRYYNALAIGNMGAGKSSILKKEFLDRACRGDYIRCFDITGEFTYLAESLGGKVLKLDGTNGILNPLEILRSDDNDAGNYTKHMSKLSTWYTFLNPEAANQEVIMFEELVRQLYVQWGLIQADGLVQDKHITGLSVKSYPTLADLLVLIQENISTTSKKKYTNSQSQIISDDLLTMNRILHTLQNIINNYGNMFCGHTSIANIADVQIVVFDISNLKDMKDTVFDAQIFNILMLCWDNSIQNGVYMKNLYETKKIDLENVIHSLILIDESHRWINTKKLQAVDMIKNFLREGRKYFCGLFLASQSIRDFVPEGSSDAAINAIKVIFELSQYKFIFAQDSNVINLLNSVFGNSLTQSEIDRIPKLERGQCILSITSDVNVELKVKLTTKELDLFRGGV